jgi:hypothetical protein
MRRPLLLGATLLGSLSSAGPAMAQEAPVIVEYVAPPEPGCASRRAFEVLLDTEVARSPNPHRHWRWSLHIHRRGGDYEGTLTSERGSWTITAPWCDDVTATVASIIARGEPEVAPSATGECVPPPPSPPPPPVEPPPHPPEAPPPRVLHPGATPAPEWRFGARAELSHHSYDGSAVTGGFGVASIELPWGFKKMMFEIALGGMSTGSDPNSIRYYVLDTQACLVDLPLGATGLSALGCLRLAGASFAAAPFIYDGTTIPQNGGALWTGVGARLRWQSNASLFVEGSIDAVYGTVSGGESTNPAWVDVTLGAGFRL